MRKKIEIELINHTSGTREIRGLNGENGKDGETPSDERLIALIEPRIPKLKQPKDGKSPTKSEIKEIIKEVLPEDKLIEKIVQKVPKIKGDKGDKGDVFRFADLTPYEKQVLTGPQGSNGVGVPRYGTEGQVLAKRSSKDFDTEWITGGGGGAVDSVNGQTGVVVLDADDIDETASRIWFTTAEETKLGGIETGAEVNTIDTVSDTTEIDLAITARDLTATIRSGSIDETKLDTSVNASLDLADTAVQPAGLSGYELLANKATDFTTINNTLYPTVQAVNTAINTAVTGLLDYRGSYDASTNLFPATGGSGILGAILSGDFWICSVPGTLGGTPVTNGDLIIAIVDTPGQTAGNWDLIENTLGYTPENVANKENTTIDTNTTKYPTVNLLKTGLDTKQATLVSGTNIKTVNSTTLLGSGDLAVATTAQGALADSALQPGDIASGTITARADDINFSGGIDGDVLTVQADGSLALEAAAAGGANVALSNLSGVAINTSLISDTNNTDDIGSTGVRWKKGWFVDMEVTNPIAGSITGNAATVTTNANLTGPVTSTGNATAIANGAISNAMLANSAVANLSGTNTGDQTSIVGITGTKAQFDTAVTDGNILYTDAIGSTVQAYDAELTTWAGVTPGTGVATALAVNVGTAGSPVINGGALGTPSSGTATNLTGTASGLTAGDSTKIGGITVTGTPAVGYVPTATSTTAATWQATSGGTPKTKFSTTFEAISRFTTGSDGTGSTPTVDTAGLNLRTGSNGAAKIIWSRFTKEYQQMPSLQLSMNAYASDTGNSDGKGDLFFGLGNFGMAIASSGITFTDKHIGVKIIKNLSNTYDIIGTQADGTTEAVTSTIATTTGSQLVSIIIDITSITNVDFYVSVEYGAYATASLGSTNRPTGALGYPIIGVSSHGSNSSQRFGWDINGASFEH